MCVMVTVMVMIMLRTGRRGTAKFGILEGELVHPVCAGEDVFLLVGSQKKKISNNGHH